MTLEEKYTAQMTELGTYKPAFDAEIKALAQMERELRRISKAWREDGADYASKIYDKITVLRRDILSHRDSLGLTPRGFKRLKPEDASGADPVSSPFAAQLAALEARARSYDG